MTSERKPRRARLLKFSKPVVADDTQFIRTLVWVLDRARAGKVNGYAMVYVVDGDEGIRTIEASTAIDDYQRYHVLGAIRRMEANFMARQWPPED